jgi:hypothetical protein
MTIPVPVPLWRDGLLWADTPRLDGVRESKPYLALEAPAMDAQKGGAR